MSEQNNGFSEFDNVNNTDNAEGNAEKPDEVRIDLIEESDGASKKERKPIKVSLSTLICTSVALVLAAVMLTLTICSSYYKGKEAQLKIEYETLLSQSESIGNIPELEILQGIFSTYSFEELDEELEQLLGWLEGKQFEFPIYFDIEDTSLQDETQKEVLTSLCIKFVRVMRENGYYGAVYTNKKWLTEYLFGDSLRYYCDIWYARYPHSNQVTLADEFTWNKESYGDLHSMWQYTDKGIIEGCGMRTGQTVDLNYSYKDYPSIIKKYGLNGFDNENPAKNE